MSNTKYLIFGGVFALALFASCASSKSAVKNAIPMTPSLISFVGAQNLENFYFYLSKDISLERDELAADAIRFENGVGIPVEQKYTEVIEIKRTTPGLALRNMMTEAAYVTYTPSANEVKVTVERDGKQLRTYTMDDKGVESEATVLDTNPSITYRLLGVSFETGESRLIGFAASMINPDGTFDILFDDENDGSVMYDGKMYRVVYQGDERPYLTVKLGKEVQDLNRKKRVAAGLPNTTTTTKKAAPAKAKKTVTG
jgi:hypothetical protein